MNYTWMHCAWWRDRQLGLDQHAYLDLHSVSTSTIIEMSLHRMHYYYSINQPLHLLHTSQIRNKHQVHSLWFAQSCLEPTIYYTQCKHANYYFINAVFKVLWPASIYIPVKCQPIIKAPIATWRVYLCNNSFFLYSSSTNLSDTNLRNQK